MDSVRNLVLERRFLKRELKKHNEVKYLEYEEITLELSWKVESGVPIRIGSDPRQSTTCTILLCRKPRDGDHVETMCTKSIQMKFHCLDDRWGPE
jgi:hypothetical protein